MRLTQPRTIADYHHNPSMPYRPWSRTNALSRPDLISKSNRQDRLQTPIVYRTSLNTSLLGCRQGFIRRRIERQLPLLFFHVLQSGSPDDACPFKC